MKMNKIGLNDKITADFALLVDNEKQDNYTKNMTIELGKEEYLPEFDEKLINRKYKRTLEVKFTFSKDYPISEFRKKEAVVLLNNINIVGKQAKNFKEEVDKLESLISELKAKLTTKESEFKIMEYTFKAKAEEVSKKAKEQLEQKISELETKSKIEIQEKQQFALAKFIEDLEMPFNNLAMATKAGENSDNIQVKNYCIGFSLVIKQFEQVFNDHNIELITPVIGNEFDANTQEVVDFSNNSEIDENIITKVVRQGIKIQDRVIKPASVMVNKKI
ncbi:nucleotide exchange factor GrpE [Mycoplasma buteonis]|uniref:nucleotide exchange factor GrpE n=1 Tax=Mycoplasma buteonis TaxID=171280 RepID=UPI00055A6CC0|nr:nucleotide exchange factor GrpE [Mycoplasma buteonis]